MTGKEMLERVYWMLSCKWMTWLAEEPNVKDANWDEANDWGQKYIDTYLPDHCQTVDKDVADVVYEHAAGELEESTEAFKSLTTKCNDLMKLLVTVVGAFLAIWRYAASVDADVQGLHDYLLVGSNALAAVAITCFIAAMMVLVSCLRGMPYVGTVEVRKLLDWAGEDKECAAYIKHRAAVRMHRSIVANRTTNNWIHERCDIAWVWTIVGLCVITISVGCRLFA